MLSQVFLLFCRVQTLTVGTPRTGACLTPTLEFHTIHFEFFSKVKKSLNKTEWKIR